MDSQLTDGVERILGTCAAWLRGVRRHQIREVVFEALIQGEETMWKIDVRSDGTVHALVHGEGGRLVFSGTEADIEAITDA